jgi:hypothetical protein
MLLSCPKILSASSVDGSVFLTWSPIFNANRYEIEVTINSSQQKNIYYSNTTSLLIRSIENDAFYDVRVRALNDLSSSDWSLGIIVRPKLRQSLSSVHQIPNEKKGFITLQWILTPTDFGFRVERCDVGDDKGFKRIG